MKNKELTALEALNVIYNLEDLQGGRDEFWKAYRIIEKSIKALEIIKEKEVNVHFFKLYLEVDVDYDWFEEHCRDNNEWEEAPPYNHSMKKEEFDLLKEVLG